MLTLNTLSTRLPVLLAALAAGSLLVACGDDAKLAGPADAKVTNQPDAKPEFDAMPVATIAGTLAATDVVLLDSDALAVPGGISGGSFSFSFSDLTQGGGTVVAGTTNVNGCKVTKYDPTHPPNTPIDGGLITVVNNKNAMTSPANTDGLLKTVGGCTLLGAPFNAYTCISNTAASGETINATNPPDGVQTSPQMIAFTFPTEAATIGTEKLVGSYLVVNGFTTTANFNSGATAFPIVGQDGTTLVVINQGNTTADGDMETITGGSYTILNAYLPIPAGGAVGGGFLGTGGITIQKMTAAGGFPAFTQNIDVPGTGFTLTDPGDPTMLPLTGTATDLVFGCGTGTDKCGDASTTILSAMIISGRATKQVVPAHPNFYMPTEKPGTDTWLEFTCGFIGSPSATLDAAALQAIIDFAPTRVEVRVINAGGNIVSDKNGNPLNQLFVIAGHAFVGHTTKP